MKIINRTTPKTPPFVSRKTQRLSLAVLMAIAAQGVQAAEPDPELEEVMVTGSRIRTTSGMETPNPVTVVFQTTGVPVGNTVQLTVTPAFGLKTTAITPALTGDTSLATASVNVSLPTGPSACDSMPSTSRT